VGWIGASRCGCAVPNRPCNCWNPICSDKGLACGLPRLQRAKAEGETGQGRGMRVLVVDDSVVIRNLLCEALATDLTIQVVGTMPTAESHWRKYRC